jgi:hypothetical protein
MSDERAVDEGLMIATAALTMAVKNAVIVGALRDDLPYNRREVAEVARDELRVLAHENQANSERLEELAEEVLLPGETEVSSENYNQEDSPALAQRSEIHERVSQELELLSENDAYLAEIAEKARVAAWADVGGAIEARLDRLPSAADAGYEAKRDARLRALIRVDLKALESSAKKLRRKRR